MRWIALDSTLSIFWMDGERMERRFRSSTSEMGSFILEKVKSEIFK